MRYFIEDTKDGFRFGFVRSDGREETLEVPGSHSELAILYSRADGIWHEYRPAYLKGLDHGMREARA